MMPKQYGKPMSFKTRFIVSIISLPIVVAFFGLILAAVQLSVFHVFSGNFDKARLAFTLEPRLFFAFVCIAYLSWLFVFLPISIVMIKSNNFNSFRASLLGAVSTLVAALPVLFLDSEGRCCGLPDMRILLVLFPLIVSGSIFGYFLKRFCFNSVA